jgi:AAA-like domain
MTAVAREAGLGYACENVLVGPDGAAMALYRMDMVGYPLLGETEKWALQGRLERLAHLAQADLSLWRVCRQVGDGRTVEVYLGVALTDGATGGVGSVLLGGVDRVKAYVMAALRRAPRLAITAKRLTELAGAERRMHDRLAAAVDLRRARTRELEWLLRRAPLRGVVEPDLEPFWAPDALVIEDETGEAVYEPLGWDLWRLPAAVRFEDPTHPPSLQLDSDEHRSVQALLAVGALAEEPLFPGPMAELLHAPLDDLDFPVDAVVHARWLGNRQALAQVHKRVVDAEQTYRDQLESSHGPAWQADDDRTLAREYEQVLQSGARPPMLYASLSLAVGAGDRDVLERRVERLRSAFGEVRLYRPRGLQETLWLDHLPRVDGGRVGDYVQQVTAQQFGAMVPTATTVIGDDQGLQLGHTVNGLHTPVHLDVTAPSRDDRPGGMLLSGNTGAGKTIAAELMALDALERGSLVVDFDPKGDHFWPAGVADRAQVLELAGGQDAPAGALDPLVIAPPALREDLALSYLLELLPDPPASWEHALARGVHDVSQAPRPCTRAVLRRLRELDGSAGGEVADALEVIAEVGLGRLAFGEHRDLAATSVAALTTIRVPGLVLPRQGAGRETYTRSERVSVATLSLATARAMQIVTADRTRHKLLILDESWFLLSTPQGQAFFDRLARYVRAFNATLLLLTHLVEDAPGIRNLVRGQLIMRHDSIEQIELALAMAGIEPTEERIARLLMAEPGFCVMRDLRGRVGEVQVEADPELLAQLSTTPPVAADEAVVA